VFVIAFQSLGSGAPFTALNFIPFGQALAALIPLNSYALNFRTDSWDRNGDGRRPGWHNDAELSAFTIAALTPSIRGALLLVQAPATIRADPALLMGLTVLSIRPAERSAGSLGKTKG
jgi:hypothetical protein